MISDCEEDDDYDFDDSEYLDDFENTSVNSDTPQVTTQYKIVPAEDIIHEMDKYIDKVNEIFKIKRSLIKRLLVHFKWNPERLIDRYYESSDNCRSLFKDAGIACNAPLQLAFDRQISQNTQSTGGCLVCCEDDTEIVGMLCEHGFCRSCWKTYFNTMIMENGIAENIQCMSTHCPTFVSESFIQGIITEKKVRKRYYQLVASSYVSQNKMFKWCPSPGCGHSAEVYSLDVKHITCICGTEWCFGCGQPYHAPLNSCELLKRWRKKAADESENTRWMVINTKECPKCNAAIEKNGGCNHMTCTSRSCSYEFCWICLGEWKPHGSNWYACNKYVEDTAKSALLTKERQAMERYHHYYDRYWNHKRSCELEKQSLSQHVKAKMEYIQDKLNVPWIEAQFLKEAFDILLKCRNMLKFSYVLAFYLERCSEVDIFEDNQRDLEHNTELLSELLEQQVFPGSEEDLLDRKMKINDRAAYCDTRRNLLMKDVQAGYDKGAWNYRNL